MTIQQQVRNISSMVLRLQSNRNSPCLYNTETRLERERIYLLLHHVLSRPSFQFATVQSQIYWGLLKTWKLETGSRQNCLALPLIVFTPPTRTRQVRQSCLVHVGGVNKLLHIWMLRYTLARAVYQHSITESVTSGYWMLTSGRWRRCWCRPTCDRVGRTVDRGRDDGWRAARRCLADVAVLTYTTAVIESQESVCIAIATAVRELATSGRRHVVEEAQFGGSARTSRRRQLADLYTPSTRL